MYKLSTTLLFTWTDDALQILWDIKLSPHFVSFQVRFVYLLEKKKGKKRTIGNDKYSVFLRNAMYFLAGTSFDELVRSDSGCLDKTRG